MAKLYDRHPSAVDSVSEDDIKTREYIDKLHAFSYDEHICDETSWKVFCNLTDISAGMISWYPFVNWNNSVGLCIGAGFGTIAGLLCSKLEHVVATERSAFRAEAIAERFRHVDNLEILSGDFFDEEVFEATKQAGLAHNPDGYDYIILTGVLGLLSQGSKDVSILVSYLKKIKSLLNEKGVILIGEDNRLGLRYWCGALNNMTGKAFDGLLKYPHGSRGYEFTRKEIIDLIELSGLKNNRLYYPLPDFRLPQMIFSDEYLPKNTVRERLIPYYSSNKTLIMNELDMYSDIIDNEAFKAFANSFIIECRNINCEDEKDTDERVIYATLSADRGLYGSFATCVKRNKDGYFVEKIPLYDEGKVSSANICENIKYLKDHNLSVVEHVLCDNGVIRMPYYESKTLSEYLKELANEAKVDEINTIFDEVYENIIKSSDKAEVINGDFAKYSNDITIWGPILKKAFLELIPLNTFFSGEDFVYFDQEFEIDNCPAGFVMYRAIHYSYNFIPELNSIISKTNMIKRYGLQDVWDFLAAEENAFQMKVRLINQYKLFFSHTYIDGSVIENNIDGLNRK